MNLGTTANEAICRNDLNKKLSSMTNEEILELYQGFRALQEDSPMIETRVIGNITNTGLRIKTFLIYAFSVLTSILL